MPKMLVFKFILLFVLLATVIYLQTSLSPTDEGSVKGNGVLSIFGQDTPSH